jgi:hypothetical protein
VSGAQIDRLLGGARSFGWRGLEAVPSMRLSIVVHARVTGFNRNELNVTAERVFGK